MKAPGQFVYFLQMAGVAVFASSGALAAGRKRFDLVGVLIVAATVALGGGTLRDLLLDRNPIFWLADPMYLLMCAVAALATWGYTAFRPPPMKALLYADAAGLALFTITGVRLAEQTGQGMVISCVMGVITGVAGGVLRDIFCGEIPILFRRSTLYATAAAIGSLVFFTVQGLGLPTPASSLCGILTIIILRGAAIVYGWSLPVFHFREGPQDSGPPAGPQA